MKFSDFFWFAPFLKCGCSWQEPKSTGEKRVTAAKKKMSERKHVVWNIFFGIFDAWVNVFRPSASVRSKGLDHWDCFSWFSFVTLLQTTFLGSTVWYPGSLPGSWWYGLGNLPEASHALLLAGCGESLYHACWQYWCGGLVRPFCLLVGLW